MLTDLIPEEALVPGLELSSDASELRDELASRLNASDVLPFEVTAFLHRLLATLCQDGTPKGLALNAPAQSTARQPGQIRHVPASAWQPRRQLGEPLLCALARRIVRATAELRPEHVAGMPVALNMLDRVGIALDELSKQGQWATILLTHPKGTSNRIFDLHFHTAGYPAWDHLALRLQAGLVAQISKEASKAPAVRDHNICAYCTAPKALMPLIPADRLLLALAMLEEDEAPLRDVLWQAAAHIERVTDNTRRDYVVKFLDLFHRGAALRLPSTRQNSGGHRQPRAFRLTELDPESNQVGICGATTWQALAEQAARDEDTPVLESSLQDDPESDDGSEKVTEDVERDQDCQHHWYLRNRITMDRNPGPDLPDVFQVRELAECYQAVLSTRTLKHSLADRLDRASRFMMLDMLIHTGRAPEWLATLTLDGAPAQDQDLSVSIYDAAHGVICHTPACRIGIPPRFLGADREASLERQRQAEACEPVPMWHCLPLTLTQVGLLTAYLKLRAQALTESPLSQGIQVADDKGPLFLLAQDGVLRSWTDDDTQALCQDLTRAINRRHPGWPAARPARFRQTFTAWYRYEGLDPVYELWISEHYRNELQMPAIYSRVRVRALASAYAAAQKRLRAEIEIEYRDLTGASGSDNSNPLLWRPETFPELGAWDCDDAFGSWHCPRRPQLRALFRGMLEMAASADSTTARRGYVGRLAAGLTVLTGMRPAEVCNLRASWVDLDDGTISIRGKDNFALTADRQAPIPHALRELLGQAVADSVRGPLPEDARGHYLLWINTGEVQTALTENEGNRILSEAGQRAGLRTEQAPDWYALRHFYRSYALEVGVPFEALNVLMGHQVLGCDLYNRALDYQVEVVLGRGHELADRIAQEIEWDGEPD